MRRRKNYGNCVRGGRAHLTMGKCFTCGTYNPALPGEPKPERCAGCGKDLPRDDFKVKHWHLRRKKGRPESTPRDGG